MSKKVLPAIKPSIKISSALRDFHHSLEAVLAQAKRQQRKMEQNRNLADPSFKESESVYSGSTSADKDHEEQRAPHNSPLNLPDIMEAETLCLPAKTMTFPDYKQKFDEIVVEIVRYVDCIEDLKIRSQFEFLLTDFRNLLLAENDNQDASLNAQFLDDIRRWLQGLDTENVDKLMDTEAVNVISVSAAIKLQEARELQVQVGEIHNYFTHATKGSSKNQVVRPGYPTNAKPIGYHAVHYDSAKECWTDATRYWMHTRDPRAQAEPADMDLLRSDMHAMTKSIEMSEQRRATLTEGNALLTNQIGEVETILAESDKYLEMIRKGGPSAVTGALRRKMCHFQELTIERIVNYIEVLHSQLQPLEKQEDMLSKRKANIFANYHKLRKKEGGLDAVLAKETAREDFINKTNVHGERHNSTACSNADLFVVMKAVVGGIDIFLKTCREIWEDAIRRIIEETGVLLTSHRNVTSKRNVKTFNFLSPEKSKHLETQMSGLRMLETIANDFSHLMILTRLKDLQLISIDHKIGVIYLTLRAKAAMKQQCSGNSLARMKRHNMQFVERTPLKKKQIKTRSASSHIAVVKPAKTVDSATVSSNLTVSPNRFHKTCSALHQQLSHPESQKNGQLGPERANNDCTAEINSDYEDKANSKIVSTDMLHMASTTDLKFPLDVSCDTMMIGPSSGLSASDVDTKIISPWLPHNKEAVLQKPLERSGTSPQKPCKPISDHKNSTLPKPSCALNIKYVPLPTATGIGKPNGQSVPRINVAFPVRTTAPTNRVEARDILPLICRKCQGHSVDEKPRMKPTDRVGGPKFKPATDRIEIDKKS